MKRKGKLYIGIRTTRKRTTTPPITIMFNKLATKTQVKIVVINCASRNVHAITTTLGQAPAI